MNKRRPCCLMLAAAAAVFCCRPALAERFNIALLNNIDSKSAHAGAKVEGRLLTDIHRNGKLLAPAGSLVTGHITAVAKSRHVLHAEVSPKRWMRASGGVGLEFTQVLPPHHHPLSIKAMPVEVLNTKDDSGKKGETLAVNKQGLVQEKRSKEMKPKAARTALGVAAIIGAPLTPIIGGVTGAVKPSAVLGDPQDAKAAKHRRLKGMATGIVAGIPGGFLVNDAVLKGHDAVLRRGTRLVVEMKE